MINHVNVQNMPLAANLLYWQNELGLNSVQEQPEEIGHSMDVASMAFQGGIIDSSINTRAGLFTYFNALLHARPIFEDDSVTALLNARYKGDIGSLMTDVIVSTFDVLANAMYRSENPDLMKILRSFLVNKLPVFLSNYVGMLFEPLSAEFCISQAMERLDPTAFPSVSQIGDLLGSSGTLSEAKQEFLFACALHHLLPESSIEIILGDVPMQSLPAGGKYTRDRLVSQCTSNSSRIDELVAELDNLEGNAGEIALAIVQVRLSQTCIEIATISRSRYEYDRIRAATCQADWRIKACSRGCSFPSHISTLGLGLLSSFTLLRVIRMLSLLLVSRFYKRSARGMTL